MTKRRLVAVALGALTGGFLALGAMALVVGNVAIDTVDAVVLSQATSRVRPTFAASAGAVYTLVIVLGALAGIVIGLIAYLLAREIDPDRERFPLRYLLAVAAVTSAVVAYAGLRTGVGAVGSITAGVVTLSVFRATVVAVVTGAAAGAATAFTMHVLVEPSFLGLEGAAWPKTRREFLVASAKAVLAPIVAVAVAGGAAVGLAQIMLSLTTEGAVIFASAVAVVVLGGAALLAARPWDKQPPSAS
jgi:hypothetical protein